LEPPAGVRNVPNRDEPSLKTGGLMGGNEKTMSQMTTKLINPYTGELQCKICGTVFYSSVKPLVGEVYYHTEYSCPNGCNVNPDITDEFR
jgi:transcription elongation factor Elf1